jgi:DNA (cytosine-5)-methyltransferase 1
MTFGSLFAGIGGFDLALERAGMRCLWNVEIDPSCRKLLADKFPHAEQHEDVRTCGRSNLAPVDLICGGFPCQDLSVAGARAGLGGKRSGLFYELTRITHELKPAYLLWENVPGLFSSDEGRDLARVMLELDRIGCAGAWRTFDAQYFGLAQRRRRIFGLFTRLNSGAGGCAEILSLAEGMRGHPAPSREAGKGVAHTLDGRVARSGESSFHTSGGLVPDVSGPFGRHTEKGGLRTTDLDGHGAYIPEVARAINAELDGYNDGSDQTYIPVVAGCVNPGSHPGSYNGQDAGNDLLIAFSSKDHGADAGELAPTLRAMGHDKSHMNAGGQVAVAYTLHGADKTVSTATETDIAGSVRTKASGSIENSSTTAILQTAQALRSNWRNNSNPKTEAEMHIQQGMSVRRLTPRECERLQGFPDDWTAGFSDSVRYRMLGNAVAVPVVEWIGKRLIKRRTAQTGMVLT